MHTKIFSATTLGVHAHVVEVEVDLSLGMLNFFIVGLPDAAIKESRQRIQTALKNCGIRLPERKITVNLAPADLKKEGSLFDLPMAIGILQAAGHLSLKQPFLYNTLFMGELSLDGSIKPIKGALAIAYDANKLGKNRIVVPKKNAQEAALIKDIHVIGVNHLVDLIALLRHEKPMPHSPSIQINATRPPTTGFSSIKGQAQAKRALTIAAAGKHHTLFIGPPGSGKTLLAQRLAHLMPPMSFNEMLETSKIYSVSGKFGTQALVTQRPFRNPHHTISQAGLIGGGSFPQPGEISLAHNGVLFLDELTEFKRATLEVLRQPLENKNVCIARAQQSVSFPSSFVLIAALNPCPCGFFGDTKKQCSCSSRQISRYLERLSGPLLDRIDIQVPVLSIDYQTMKESCNIQTEPVDHVDQAVYIQHKRFNREHWNAQMTPQEVEQWCPLSQKAEAFIKKAFDMLALSMRGYHKLLKVARTIADLAGRHTVDLPHVQEALMYRSLDQYFETKQTEH